MTVKERKGLIGYRTAMGKIRGSQGVWFSRWQIELVRKSIGTKKSLRKNTTVPGKEGQDDLIAKKKTQTTRRGLEISVRKSIWELRVAGEKGKCLRGWAATKKKDVTSIRCRVKSVDRGNQSSTRPKQKKVRAGGARKKIEVRSEKEKRERKEVSGGKRAPHEIRVGLREGVRN